MRHTIAVLRWREVLVRGLSARVADDGVVGTVDLGCQPLGFDAFASVGETIGVESFDQLPALAMNLLDGCAWIEAQPVVGGEYVEGIFSRDEARGGGAPVPFAATRGPAFCVPLPGCMSQELCGENPSKYS